MKQIWQNRELLYLRDASMEVPYAAPSLFTLKVFTVKVLF